MNDLSERKRRYWTAVIFGFIGTTAIGFQMRGALLPSLQRSFDVDPSLLGLVATAGTVGFVMAVLVTGMMAGRIDIGRVSRWSVLLVGCSIVAMALAPSFATYLVLLLVRGIATGPFRGLDRAVLSHLYPEGRARIFNQYALVWALGAATGPLVVTGALALGNWRFAYLALAVVFLPVIALVWLLDIPASVGTEEPITIDRIRQLLRRPPISGMAGALVLNGGVEGTLFTWLPYFASRLFRPGLANLVLTTYLLAYVPGRLFYSYLADRHFRSITLVTVLAVCAIPLFYLTVYTVRGWSLFVVVFLLGFTVSGIFPTLSAFGVEVAPSFSGPVNAISTSTSYLGIATVPPIVGLLASQIGIELALALPLGLLCVLVLVVGSTQQWVTRTDERSPTVE